MNKRGDILKNPYSIVIIVLILFILLVLITVLVSKKEDVQPIEFNQTEEKEAECQFCNEVRETNSIGIRGGNIEECDSLGSPEAVEFCRTNTIMDKAISESNPELCNQLSPGQVSTCRDNVLSFQALNTQNKNLCNDITNEDTRNMCLNSIT